MAYSDYGAFVYMNGERRRDKEDAEIFENEPLIFSVHGVLGDGDVRVACYKQGLPTIYFRVNKTEPTQILWVKEICELVGMEDLDFYEYPELNFEFCGYKFILVDKNNSDSGHYEAEMIEPDGTHWKCVYDYGYGAGLTDE